MKLPRIGPRRGLGRGLEALVWIGLFAFIGRRIWPQIAAAFGVASANAAVPAFQLTTLDGTTVSSASLRGQVVLVNFWATWCPPCRVEMPGFQRIYEAKRAQGFTILGIATDAAGSRPVFDFLRERRITYPIAMATGSVVRDFGGGTLLPTSFLIDRQGRIRNEVRGIFAPIALKQAVDRLLAEGSAPAAPTGGVR
jgi:peroxiredoxin